MKLFHQLQEYKTAVCLSVVFGTLWCASIFLNTGYYHYDEHYQIIEFALYKLGLNEPENMAWEFSARIRPTFQPTLAAACIKVFHLIGVKDAYSIAFFLRLLSAAVALISTLRFLKVTIQDFDRPYRIAYVMFSFGTWFLPYLLVRFSSENWSGLFLVFAISHLYKIESARKSDFTLSGILMGLSFVCRFQSAFSILGIFCWLIFFAKVSRKSILLLLIGFFIVFSIGVLIDCWFYHSIVFTPWNYFHFNIIQGVASQFGTSPWYYYFIWFAKLPLGIVALFFIAIFLRFNHRSLVFYTFVPFLICHCLIAHKEARFLFPVAALLPFMFTKGYAHFSTLVRNDHFVKKSLIYLTILVTANGIALAVTLSGWVGNSSKKITQAIAQSSKYNQTELVYFRDANPYDPLINLGLRESFYRKESLSIIDYDDFFEFEYELKERPRSFLLCILEEDIYDTEFLSLKNRYKINFVQRSVAEWTKPLNLFYDENPNIYLLYTVNSPE